MSRRLIGELIVYTGVRPSFINIFKRHLASTDGGTKSYVFPVFCFAANNDYKGASLFCGTCNLARRSNKLKVSLDFARMVT